MTAERLREAANVLRERAEAATPGRWYAEPNTMAGRVWVAMGRKWWPKTDAEPLFQVRSEDGYKQREHDAAYIATVSPPFALAVADWLEATAREFDSLGIIGLPKQRDGRRTAALAVASAVLGEDAGGDGR